MADGRQKLPAQVSISFTVIEGPDQGRRYPVRELPAVIGAGEICDLALAGTGVREAHARLSLAGGGLYLEAVSADAVTRVNDLSARRVQLRNGDIVEVGEVKLLAQLTIPAGVALADTARPEGRTGRSARVWAAGFDPDTREWFEQEVGQAPGLETKAFRSGEDLLTAVSEALANDRQPDLLILDLRLPIINGINVAVATRAFELGFNRLDRIPLVFLFNAPEATNFDKVLNFCQPAKIVAPGDSNDSLKRRMAEAARSAVKGA